MFSGKIFFWNLNFFLENYCYWAHIHRFLSVCLSVCLSVTSSVLSRDPSSRHFGWEQGQRSLGSRSKVTGVKVSQALKIMVGGLTSTPSCFIFWSPLKKIWVPKRSQRFTNYCPVNFYLVRIFVTTDRQTDRQTDTKQCLRAHCAWAQVGSIKAHVMALSSIVILWLTA